MGSFDILRRSYSVLERNIKKFMLIGVAFWLIISLVVLSFVSFGLVTVEELYALDSVMGNLMSFVMSLIIAVFSGGVYYAISCMKKQKIMLGNITCGIKKYLPDIFKAFILVQLIMYAVFFVLDVFMLYYPSSATIMSVAFYLLVICFVFLVQLSFVFSIPIVVIEKSDGFKAVAESVLFFKGNAGLVLKTFVLMIMFYMSAFLGLLGFSGFSGYVLDVSMYLGVPLLILSLVFILVFFVLSYSFVSILLVTLYK
ncbi:MAG: hypothetical protein U9P44_00020 [archaeon]|nr:hypothetical protein [archaeon]